MSGSDGDHSMRGGGGVSAFVRSGGHKHKSDEELADPRPRKSTTCYSGKVWLRKKKFALATGKGALAAQGRVKDRPEERFRSSRGPVVPVEAVDDKGPAGFRWLFEPGVLSRQNSPSTVASSTSTNRARRAMHMAVEIGHKSAGVPAHPDVAAESMKKKTRCRPRRCADTPRGEFRNARCKQTGHPLHPRITPGKTIVCPAWIWSCARSQVVQRWPSPAMRKPSPVGGVAWPPSQPSGTCR